MTLSEFAKKFGTDEQCREYLYQLRWPAGFVCPRCQHAAKPWPIGGILYKCSKCSHQTSVTAGTILQDIRAPLTTWFAAVWWTAAQKNGVSAKGLQEVIGLNSYQTAWAWSHKIRKTMVHPRRLPLSGIVEVIVMDINIEKSGRKCRRAADDKTVIVVAVESKSGKGIGRMRLCALAGELEGPLQEFIAKNIARGSAVITDSSDRYAFLPAGGYEHKVASGSSDHMRSVVSSLIKWLNNRYKRAVASKYLQSYLDEYVFRFNRKSVPTRSTLFHRLMKNAMSIPPHTY